MNHEYYTFTFIDENNEVDVRTIEATSEERAREKFQTRYEYKFIKSVRRKAELYYHGPKRK